MIDSHQHFIDATRFEYPWMGPGDPLREQAFTPLTYRAATSGHDCQSVVVQALDAHEETRWLLDLAADDETIIGVVGWVDLAGGRVGDTLRALRRSPGGHKLCGIRHLTHNEPDPDWLVRPRVVDGLRAVAQAGLTFDLLLRARELPPATRLVQMLPDLRFVVDHLAKPQIRSGWRANGDWAAGLTRLGSHPNVWCKLSGMVTEADPANWEIGDLRPFAAHAMQVFGPRRMLFGSDWPVCLGAADFAGVADAARALVTELVSAEGQWVFVGAASDAYHLNPARSLVEPEIH